MTTTPAFGLALSLVGCARRATGTSLGRALAITAHVKSRFQFALRCTEKQGRKTLLIGNACLIVSATCHVIMHAGHARAVRRTQQARTAAIWPASHHPHKSHALGSDGKWRPYESGSPMRICHTFQCSEKCCFCGCRFRRCIDVERIRCIDENFFRLRIEQLKMTSIRPLPCHGQAIDWHRPAFIA